MEGGVDDRLARVQKTVGVLEAKDGRLVRDKVHDEDCDVFNE